MPIKAIENKNIPLKLLLRALIKEWIQLYKPRKLVFHIKELTKKHGIAQNELARRADIEPARLSELANGKKQKIQISYITKIAEELDINDINEIMTIEYDEEDEE